MIKNTHIQSYTHTHTQTRSHRHTHTHIVNLEDMFIKYIDDGLWCDTELRTREMQ